MCSTSVSNINISLSLFVNSEIRWTISNIVAYQIAFSSIEIPTNWHLLFSFSFRFPIRVVNYSTSFTFSLIFFFSLIPHISVNLRSFWLYYCFVLFLLFVESEWLWLSFKLFNYHYFSRFLNFMQLFNLLVPHSVGYKLKLNSEPVYHNVNFEYVFELCFCSLLYYSSFILFKTVSITCQEHCVQYDYMEHFVPKYGTTK